MAFTKPYQLIYTLRDRTNSGKLVWQETSEDNVYQSSLPNYSIQITTRLGYDENSQSPETEYVLRIYDGQSKLIEELDDSTIYKENKHNLQKTNVYPYFIMEELFIAARRQALGVVSSGFRGWPSIMFGVIADDDQVKDDQITQIIGKGANLIGFGAKLAEKPFQKVG
jgi:hypothetical protein